MKYKRYDSKSNYSYALGLYPTLELMRQQPDACVEVVYSQKAPAHKGFSQLLKLCSTNKIKLSQHDILTAKLSHKANTSVVGIFKKYPMQLQTGANHLVLYRTNDIGNLGMIIRSALAFDISDIAVITPAVDCFNPGVIRASMGAFFSCNIEYFADLQSYIGKHSNQLYAFDINGGIDLQNMQAKHPFSLLFGSEAHGLPTDALASSTTVKVPYNNSRVESLNLANTASIVLAHLYSKLKTT